MKKVLFPFLIGCVIGSLIFSCENEDQIISSKIINDPVCKNSKSDDYKDEIPDSLSCIYYSFEKSGKKLSIKHVNAGFNCCPGELTCNVAMSGDTIIISEYEESPLCDCDCLYDLEIEITGIASGQYQVRFIEPYSGSQKKLIFQINLTDHPEGSFCVIRKQYPRGMGS